MDEKSEDIKKMSYKDETGKNYEVAYSTEIQMKVYQELKKSNRLKMLLLAALGLACVGLFLVYQTRVFTNIIAALFCPIA